MIVNNDEKLVENVDNNPGLSRGARSATRKLSRYCFDDSYPDDHDISPKALHLAKQLRLHGKSRRFVFPLYDGTLTLFAVRDQLNIRKYTLLVRVKNHRLTNVELLIKDGRFQGSILHLDQSFGWLKGPERFVEQLMPDRENRLIEVSFYIDKTLFRQDIHLQ